MSGSPSTRSTITAPFSASSLSLRDVYQRPDAAAHLYALLGEREPFVNISHWQMPAWNQHLDFIDRRPYREWWLIETDGTVVGTCYLSRQNEIGIFVYRDLRRSGIGAAAVRLLMNNHPGERLLANINPANRASRALFEKLGFRHVQDTLALEAA